VIVDMLFGKKALSLEVPDEQVTSLLEAKQFPAGTSEEELISEALSKPIDSLPLSELVCSGEKVVIVISDITRAWVKHDRFLPALLNELNRGGVADKDIVIVSATGDHRGQDAGEHSVLTGEEIYGRVPVYDHSSRDSEGLVSVGRTSRGTDVRINRRVAEADRVIITGGITYHFLAGWGGGKKALVPGVAAREAIMANHGIAFLPGDGEGLNPAVCAGRVIGNPLAEDMLEAADLIGPDFLLNTVIDEDRGIIAGVFAGHYKTAHEKGCRFVDEHFRVPLRQLSKVVIASCGGYPKDINFYQTYKTIYNAQLALQKRGTLFLISESSEGVGSDQFFEIFTAYKSNPEREAALRRDYSIGGQMAYHTALIAEENDLLVLSSLPEETVLAMGMIPVRSLSEGLDWIKNKHGADVKICIMPHGGSTLPELC
jgi:lactate racemase